MTANPNTMTLKQVFDDQYALTHYKQPVYKAFADERLVSKLSKGNTVNRSYSSNFVVNTMGGDGGYSTQAVVDTNEQIVIDHEREVSFYLKELDLEQAHLPVKMKYAEKAMNQLFLQIDGDVLQAGYQGAGSSVDDGTIGGTTGNGISAGVGNVQNIFAAALQALQLQNVIYEPNAEFTGEVKLDTKKTMPVAAISPQLYNQVILYLGGKNTDLGDKISMNGHMGKFMNFNLFVSNNLAWSGSLAIPTLPIDGDTVTVNGVTFTFKDTMTPTAGQVLLGTSAGAGQSAANAMTNLIAAINTPGTTTTTFTALSVANQNKLKNMTASQATGAVSVVASGYGNVVVSQSMTAAGNVWTAGKQQQHNLFGVSKSITVIIQKRPNFVVNPVTGKVGKDYVTWTAYGIKVFRDQAPMLVDVQIASSAFITQPTQTT